MPYFSFNNRKKRQIFFSKYIIKKSDFFIFFYSKNINGHDKKHIKIFIFEYEVYNNIDLYTYNVVLVKMIK